MTIWPKRIDVACGERSYPVFLQCGLLSKAGELLAPHCASHRLVIVTDPVAWAVHGGVLAASLTAVGIVSVPIFVDGGEESKSWKCLVQLIDQLLELDVERGETLAAFGGGVIGDLTGFAASILKRGCPYVQIPTTLLAQVDSAVGGKTGINAPHGKNLIGAFHQPATVLIDPGCLESLPLRQLRAGYAEIVKYGLINDAEFFDWCERNVSAVLTSSETQCSAIARCVAAKGAIVGRDEEETSGDRALLNLGHTFAHALEAHSGYSDRLLHGEAVSLGLVLAFRFSAQTGLCDPSESERVAAHLASAGLPTELGALGFETSGNELVELMKGDKKANSGRLPFILARGIGKAFIDRDVDLANVAAFLDDEFSGNISDGRLAVGGLH